MYKLIAIDLDGTLLNSYGEISLRNKEAIAYAKKKGVKVILASGRDPKTMEKISEEIETSQYLIAGNGASVFDINLQQNIYENYLKKEKALQVIKICKENSIFFSVYTTQGILTEGLQYNIKVFNNENSYRPNKKRTNIEIVKDVYTCVQESNFDILKIIVCDADKIIFRNIVEKFRALKNVEVLDVEHMSRKFLRTDTEEIPIEYYYTEITNQNANKWKAIQFLTNKLNISSDEVMCIGDNMNDYEMIKNAGMGIAMKNSALEKQNIADYITDDNNTDGVGNAIFRYI